MSWQQLIDIRREAAQLVHAQRVALPTACPRDGEPLRTGPGGVLWCPFDGWQYPRDHHN
jgi:hypothetical protein